MRSIDEDLLKETLEYIRDTQRLESRTPSYREIMKQCRFSSTCTVSRYVDLLKERGYLENEVRNGKSYIGLPVNLDTSGYHHAQLVGRVPCGQPELAIEDIQATVVLPDEIFGNGNHMLLRASGPSMIKRGIFDGDLLVVNRDDIQPTIGTTVVAMLEDGTTTCKVFSQRGKRYYLEAANDDTDAKGRRIYDVNPNQAWQIIGTVDFVIHAPVRNEF